MQYLFAVRSSIAFLVILFIAAGTGRAQQYPCSDYGAFAVDTTTIVQPIALSNGTCQVKGGGSTETSWELTLMFTSAGTPSLVVSVGSVQFSGCDPDSLDPVSTAALFELIDEVSVRRALDSGLIATPSLGTSRNINVYHAGCVSRTGRGDSTHFTAVGGGCCRKTFAVANSYAGISIALIGSNGPSCGSEYDSTCDDEAALLSFLDN